MKKTAILIFAIATTFCLGFTLKSVISKQQNNKINVEQPKNSN